MKDFYRIEPEKWLFLDNRKVKSYQEQALKNRESNLEEYVRQWVIKELIDSYNYPIEQIDVEYPVRVGADTRFADVIIYNKTGKPYIYVETKGYKVLDDSRQVKSYVAAEITCLFGMWTNGETNEFFQKIIDPNDLVNIKDLPYYGITGKVPITKLNPVKNFIQLLKTCHNILRSEESYHPDEAFDEMSKILYAKIHDEFNPDPKYGYRFQRNLYSSEEELQSSVLAIYEEAKKEEEFLFTDTIKIKPTTLYKITEKIDGFSIVETGLDTKGMAFESFLGTTFRGQLGQYFTPRQIVEFMVGVADPSDSDIILDTACGSGGFLLYALNYVRNKIDSTQKVKKIAERKKYDFSHDNVYGIEISPRLSRIAMMNMIISEDGHTNIRNEDALLDLKHYIEKPPFFKKEGFSLVLTNPPFGAKSTVKAKEVVSNFFLGSKKSKRKTQKKDILFIERNLEFLKIGGLLGIVLPDGILGNPSLKYVREFILENAKLKAVISISEDAFKPSGAGVKSSLLFLEKKKRSDKSDYTIFMAEVEKIGFDATGRPTENELPLILEAYRRETVKWNSFQQNRCRRINMSEIENLRFEAFYYNPIHKKLETELKKLANDEISVKPLSELGVFVDKLTKAERDKEFEESETRNYIEISDIDNDLGEIKETTEYTQEEIPNNAQKIVKKGDVIISTRRPTRGAIAVVDDKNSNSLCTTFVEVFRPNEKICSDYLKYALRSSFSKIQFQRYSTFTSYPVISQEDIGKVLIPIPNDINKQRNSINKSQSITNDVIKLKKELKSTYDKLEVEVEHAIYDKLKI